MPLGNSGGSPGFVIMDIFNGFILKWLTKDFLIYSLLSKNFCSLLSQLISDLKFFQSCDILYNFDLMKPDFWYFIFIVFNNVNDS